MKILYADTDPVSQINFVRALKANEDWSAKYALAIPALTNSLDKEKFDVIITDLEFVDQVRNATDGNSVIIAMGDLEDFSEVKDLLDNGVNHYLKKPFCSNAFQKIALNIQQDSCSSSEADITPDFAYLDRLTKGRMALKLDLMEIYLTVVGEEVDKTKIAITEKDNMVISTSAHRMKSNVRMMGLQTLMQLLDKIESDAKCDGVSPDFYDIVSDTLSMLTDSMEVVRAEIVAQKSMQTA